jgi:hypothetical protein
MEFKNTGCEGAHVILLAQDGDKCPTVVNTVMNLRAPHNAMYFFTSLVNVGLSKRVIHIEVDSWVRTVHDLMMISCTLCSSDRAS